MSKIKKFLNILKNKRIMICGFGKSNSCMVKMLLDANAYLIICDYDKKTKKIFQHKNLEYRLGENYLEKLDVDIIIRTPGLNYFSENLIKARKKNIIVTSEIEIFFDLCPCEIIGVTGSDGKTTTSTLIYEILKTSKEKVYLGGNIGDPLLPLIYQLNENDIVIVELSSFQLISMRKSPDISVITNLSPNHLDIHKNMVEYVNSKKNIFLHQNAFSKIVLNYDNKLTKKFKNQTRGKNLFFSLNKKLQNGAWISKNKIYFSENEKTTQIMEVTDIKLKGTHNLENYLAVICAIFDKVDIKYIKEVARNFNGVKHRIEFVRNLNNVYFYNDSIASSPTRTISALKVFDQKVILIAGGYDKKIPLDDLSYIILDKVKLLILLGNTSEKILESIKKISEINNKKMINFIQTNNMQEAVEVSYKNSEKQDIVLLSPAFASFDLYKNFEERGNDFKNIVNNL
ncbi:MAG: UDP-N-acetylmuramoyl-L-alanine--D-glutamate ligase [Candidatus Paraimprobicoccus trichonymphae]|uniref:UDP-N-acetylmuramoylalanine--D-glutamate ligase n=1 Tax=Candidatus Paraimprobicoccus trichonymphae TaxID=3033793 RepID=A0AA48HZ28_9FIRM|nr:MAG: UDP-N-acetylmuramoyl-L-alanine--D-glutamate ligase [Candidatus Paraimprobicoccus trichonymphae]